MSGDLGAAIVGCGVIGLNHARAIARTEGIRVTALVDVEAAAAEALAQGVAGEGGGRPRAFDDLGSALAAGGVDLVVICTPSGLHAAQAEEALAAGAHVLVEKPLDVELPRARRILDLARRHPDRVVSVMSQHRFDPAAEVVARTVRAGGFGRITGAVATVSWWRSQQYYDSGRWRGTWRLDGGGALMNQGVHTVDLLLWFLGRPVEVAASVARMAHDGIEVEDVAAATVRFASGALAVLHATTAAYPGIGTRVQVHGTLGSAVIHDDRLEYFHALEETDLADGSGARDQSAEVVDAEHVRGGARDADAFVRGHARQYADVVAAIRARVQPAVRVEDALAALALVRSVYVSATLARPVPFDDVLEGAYDGLDPVVRALAPEEEVP